MILFPEEQESYVLQELESFGADILGQGTLMVRKEKAEFLIANRKWKEHPDDMKTKGLLGEMTSK